MDYHLFSVSLLMVDACEFNASDVFEFGTVIACDVLQSPVFVEVFHRPAIGPLGAVSESAYFADVVNSARLCLPQ